MKTTEFEKKFDESENITAALDLSKTRRPALKLKRVNVDFPNWMIASLDQEAKHLGISRQAVIKTVLGEHLQKHQQ